MPAKIPDLITATSIPVVAINSWAVAVSAPFSALGIGAAVLFMAMTGVAAGLLLNPPGISRWRLFAKAFALTMLSAASATVLPEMAITAWLKPVTPPIALLIGFFSQALLPVLTEALKTRTRNFIGGEQ